MRRLGGDGQSFTPTLKFPVRANERGQRARAYRPWPVLLHWRGLAGSFEPNAQWRHTGQGPARGRGGVLGKEKAESHTDCKVMAWKAQSSA